jgi:5-oxoprolinase (ATP-hydrolysing) subunit C
MGKELVEILDPGLGAALQDQGRRGWRKYGVPPGGVMDAHAAGWANRLLDNPPDAPVLELLLQGANLLILQDGWFALTGADAEATLPMWRAIHCRAGEVIELRGNRSGVWTYLAVECGFEGRQWLGSVSAYARGGLGKHFGRGDRLCRNSGAEFQLPAGVAGRILHWEQQRDYLDIPPVKVWPGPQWELFSDADRCLFFGAEWTVAPRSDRIGYRLNGPALSSFTDQLISEPVLAGSIQIPPGGIPIVTMRDGPTVGGYPKLGLVDPDDLDWVAQCRPGAPLRFRPAE